MCQLTSVPRRGITRALLAAGLATGALTTGALTTGAAPAASLPTPPAIPACPHTITIRAGTTGPTSPPRPLPTSPSTIGGAALSRGGLQVDLPPGVPVPPAVPVTAWLVVDLTGGKVIAACNAHVPLAPASTLKILTSLTLAHRLDWRSRYVGRPADPATDGTKVGIVEGSTYTVRDLFHALMLDSANDAATALATLAGGMPATASAMNAQSRALGGFDTYAVNDSGLDAPGQVTSAYDLALFGRAALRDPVIAPLLRTPTYTFPGRGSGSDPERPTYQIQNHNWLLRNYAGATGVKNGYTVAAGSSYVGSATRGSRSYLVTMLHGEGATWRDARKLLDWAFTAGGSARPVGRLVDPGEVATLGRSDPVTAPGATGATGAPDATAEGAPVEGAPVAGAAALAVPQRSGAPAPAGARSRQPVALIAGAVLAAVGAIAALAQTRRPSPARARRPDPARHPDHAGCHPQR